MTERSSVFIKIDNYRDVLDLADELKQQLSSVRNLYEQLEDMRDNEHKELQSWKQNLDAIEERLGEVDQTLFEPEQ